MDQRQRLGYLVKAFIDDSEEYGYLKADGNEARQRELLRSLMNVRLPKPIDPEVVKVQDEYLKERNRDNGIVELKDIPTVADEGSKHAHGNVMSVWQGDITRLKVDAIVNAANNEMLGCFIPMHTCIDNCIHTYAGIQLRAECNEKMRELRRKYGESYVQSTSVPMLTGGYNLPASHVIHVVGPIVRSYLSEKEKRELRDCYINVLDMCRDNGLRSVVFCCISTGVFHFPNDKAAEIAVNTVTEWLNANPDTMERVIFNVFKEKDRELYRKQF